MAKLGKTIDNVIRGDNRTIALTFNQADGSTPINLAGGTVYFTLNSSDDPADDTSAVFQKTATDTTPFTSPSTGQHTFTLSHSDTNIAAGTYWYDTEFVDATSSHLSSYKGKFIVVSDITRT